jgi:hypothetical protein
MSGFRLVVCLALVCAASLAYARTAAASDGSTPALPVPVSATAEVAPTGVAVTASVAPVAAVEATAGTESAPVEVAVTAEAPVSTVTEPTIAPTAPADPSTVPSTAAVAPSPVSRPLPAHPRTAHPRKTHERKARVVSSPSASRRVRPAPLAQRVAPHAEKRVSRSASFAPVRGPSPAGSGAGGGSGIALSAIFVTFVLLAAPSLGRRLRPAAELARPPALLSVLERPG